MSERVVVPEGMREAAESASEEYLRSNQSKRGHAYAILEAALLWLSENPIVPTVSQLTALSKDSPYQADQLAKIDWIIDEWQRRMFRAPEVQPQSFDTPFGRFTVDARVPPGELRLENWNGPTLLRCAPPEPEVPEAAKDDELCGILTELADAVVYLDRIGPLKERIKAYGLRDKPDVP